jgi:hypothetical protein
MELNFVHIISFQAIHHAGDKAVVILGLGDDGWMYQYRGENGTWEKLSPSFPGFISLPGSETPPVVEETKEAVPEVTVVAPEVVPEVPAAPPEAVPEAPAEVPPANT